MSLFGVPVSELLVGIILGNMVLCTFVLAASILRGDHEVD